MIFGMWALGSCFLRLIRVGHISRKLYEHLEHGTGCSGTVAIAKTRRQSGHFVWCSWGPSTHYTEVEEFLSPAPGRISAFGFRQNRANLSGSVLAETEFPNFVWFSRKKSSTSRGNRVRARRAMPHPRIWAKILGPSLCEHPSR